MYRNLLHVTHFHAYSNVLNYRHIVYFNEQISMAPYVS
jgi:hypothetical protein